MAARLFVADPGLKTASGHNAGAMLTLSEALPGSSFFGHAEPDAELQALVARSGVLVQRFFSRGLYEAYAREWTLGEAHPYVSALTSDYLRLLRQLDQERARGVVLHHSMDWPQLQALAAARSIHGAGWPGLKHAVFLICSPGVGHDGQVFSPRRYLGYRVALALLLRGVGLRLFASSCELSDAYARAFAMAAPPPVHPCFFFDATQAAGARQAPGTRILLYAGDAKAEKGFCAVPGLARALLHVAPPDTELVVHYTLNAGLATPPVEQAAETLRDMTEEEGRLIRVTGFLAERELRELFASASCAVFNYDPTVYAEQTSGMLWQACGAGTPLVVIGRSWLAREARRINPRVRVYPDAAAALQEFARDRAINFERAPIDTAYRARLFRPPADFLREELGIGAPTESAGASTEPAGYRPSLLPKRT
jgi:hypothetical protein